MDAKKRHVLVAGGRLQGTEIAYLARKAGHRVTLVDHSPAAPAAGLADRFVAADVREGQQMSGLVGEADYVFPAIEDLAALDALGECCEKTGTKYIFDRDAYLISHSKRKTNRLLESLGIAIPKPFPACGFPVILKPDAASGSSGVRKIENERALAALPRREREGWVAQQYLAGPSYSLEVLGNGREAECPMITQVVTDAAYDCKRIVAPADVDSGLRAEFLRIARAINSALHIKGIFDIEVISHGGRLYVLEIDARFPSQTPISVYHASGVNFVERLIALAEGDPAPARQREEDQTKSCVYQQILVQQNSVTVCGEHIMGGAGQLRVLPGFCGADEMITDYTPGSETWRAIVILTGANEGEIRAKWERCIDKIAGIQRCDKMTYTEG